MGEDNKDLTYEEQFISDRTDELEQSMNTENFSCSWSEVRVGHCTRKYNCDFQFCTGTNCSGYHSNNLKITKGQ